MQDYEKDYEEFWKPIVEKDGQINLDQIKRELFDYHQMMKSVAEVYDHVTGGAISKPNTLPIHVKSEADRYYRELYEDECVDELHVGL